MKRWSVIAILLLGSFVSKAQNELFSRQYFLNNFLVNPAVGGVNDYMDARLSYSRQWTAIENSPSSILFTFNTNLSKEKDQVMRYSFAEKRYRVSKGRISYGYRRIKHGLGVKVTHDKANVYSFTDAALSYACHIPLNPYVTLSAGVGAGLSLSTLDLNDGYVGDVDDPLLNNGKRNGTSPLVEAGVWLYTTGPYIGASFSKYMKDPYDEDSKARYMNIYGTLGWQFLFDKVSFIPSVMYRYNGYSGKGLDVNAMLWVGDVVWFGASLRALENPSVHAGVLIKNTFEINYTYDINKKNWGASHEVGIAYRIWSRANECKNKWYFR